MLLNRFGRRWRLIFRIPGPGQTLSCLLFVFLAVAALPGPALARGSSRRSAGRYIQAQRQQMINAIQQQIAQARKVLERVESQASMSQQELQSAMSQLDLARRTTESASTAEVEAKRQLRQAEDRILAAQGPKSEYARKTAELEQAQAALDGEMHRVLSLPEHAADQKDEAAESVRVKELAILTPEQRARLDADTKYREAMDRVTDVSDARDEVRHKLLAADPEWKRINDERAAQKEKLKDEKAGFHAEGLKARNQRKQLQSAQQAAAEARAIILQGEATLRQLGVNPTQPQNTKK